MNITITFSADPASLAVLHMAGLLDVSEIAYHKDVPVKFLADLISELKAVKDLSSQELLRQLAQIVGKGAATINQSQPLAPTKQKKKGGENTTAPSHSDQAVKP